MLAKTRNLYLVEKLQNKLFTTMHCHLNLIYFPLWTEHFICWVSCNLLCWLNCIFFFLHKLEYTVTSLMPLLNMFFFKTSYVQFVVISFPKPLSLFFCFYIMAFALKAWPWSWHSLTLYLTEKTRTDMSAMVWYCVCRILDSLNDEMLK